MKKENVTKIASVLFILLFAYTALDKLLSMQQFATQLKHIAYLKPLAGWVSWIVPIFELVIAGLLIVKKTRMFGLLMCIVVMIMFTVHLIILINNIYYIPCGCGGFLEKLPMNVHIGLNIFLTMIAIIGSYQEIQFVRLKAMNTYKI